MQRHIKAWSAFITLYQQKAMEYRETEANIRCINGEIQIEGSLDLECSVKGPELASVLSCSNETARRRFIWFQERGLVQQVEKGRGGNFWKPAPNLSADAVMSMLEEE